MSCNHNKLTFEGDLYFTCTECFEAFAFEGETVDHKGQPDWNKINDMIERGYRHFTSADMVDGYAVLASIDEDKEVLDKYADQILDCLSGEVQEGSEISIKCDHLVAMRGIMLMTESEYDPNLKYCYHFTYCPKCGEKLNKK